MYGGGRGAGAGTFWELGDASRHAELLAQRHEPARINVRRLILAAASDGQRELEAGPPHRRPQLLLQPRRDCATVENRGRHAPARSATARSARSTSSRPATRAAIASSRVRTSFANASSSSRECV